MFIRLVILILFIPQLLPAVITRKVNSFVSNQWVSDSVYIGAGLFVRDSSTDVIIKWKKTFGTNGLGCLYFMAPGYRDSALFLFHNFANQFSGETESINLGKFPAGTPIDVRYIVIDTSQYWVEFKGKKLFSGQNRDSIDKFISERTTTVFGSRWAAAGRIDSALIELGFTDGILMGFDNLMVDVRGCCLEGTEKSKIPSIQISPSEAHFSNFATISISRNPDGLVNYIDRITRVDTVTPLKGAVLTYYYTLDGTNPRVSSTKKKYTTPFPISSTTTIKAFATLESDTNWFPSEVITQVYTKDEASVRRGFRSNLNVSNAASDFSLYSITGRHIRTMNAFEADVVSYTKTLPSGVYFVHAKAGGQARRVVVGW